MIRLAEYASPFNAGRNCGVTSCGVAWAIVVITQNTALRAGTEQTNRKERLAFKDMENIAPAYGTITRMTN